MKPPTLSLLMLALACGDPDNISQHSAETDDATTNTDSSDEDNLLQSLTDALDAVTTLQSQVETLQQRLVELETLADTVGELQEGSLSRVWEELSCLDADENGSADDYEALYARARAGEVTIGLGVAGNMLFACNDVPTTAAPGMTSSVLRCGILSEQPGE